jgi:hypothetical protein
MAIDLRDPETEGVGNDAVHAFDVAKSRQQELIGKPTVQR